MSNPTDALDWRVRAATVAYLSAILERDGEDLSDFELRALEAGHYAKLVEISRRVLAAADAVDAARQTPPKPRSRGPLRAIDADALRLDTAAKAVFVLALDHEGRICSAYSEAGIGAVALSHDKGAAALWTALQGAYSGLFAPIASDAPASPPADHEESKS